MIGSEDLWMFGVDSELEQDSKTRYFADIIWLRKIITEMWEVSRGCAARIMEVQSGNVPCSVPTLLTLFKTLPCISLGRTQLRDVLEDLVLQRKDK